MHSNFKATQTWESSTTNRHAAVTGQWSWLSELKQFDFRRGTAEARVISCAALVAEEGCSKACRDGEVDVCHGQSAHSLLRWSLPSFSLHPKHGNLKQLLCHVSNDHSVSARARSKGWKHLIHRTFVCNCTSMFWHGFWCDVFGSLLNLLNDRKSTVFCPVRGCKIFAQLAPSQIPSWSRSKIERTFNVPSENPRLILIMKQSCMFHSTVGSMLTMQWQFEKGTFLLCSTLHLQSEWLEQWHNTEEAVLTEVQPTLPQW